MSWSVTAASYWLFPANCISVWLVDWVGNRKKVGLFLVLLKRTVLRAWDKLVQISQVPTLWASYEVSAQIRTQPTPTPLSIPAFLLFLASSDSFPLLCQTDMRLRWRFPLHSERRRDEEWVSDGVSPSRLLTLERARLAPLLSETRINQEQAGRCIDD